MADARGLTKARGKDKDIEGKLLKSIRREMWHSMGREGGQLSVDRTQLKRRYLGYGYDSDSERRQRQLSTYVDRTVMETVEWALPGLMRVFSGDEIIRFEPRTPEQEAAAADATLYVNQVVFGRNMFHIVHDTLKDGLYQRVGWCLAHCPKREEQRVREFTGLSQEEAAALLQDPSIDLDTEGAVRVQQYDTPFGTLFDLVVHQKVEVREVAVEPVPSENVVISDDAIDVEHARFIAYWQLKTASDLRKEGYSQELIDDLTPYNSADTMPEAAVGRRINSADTETYEGYGANREYKVYEGWLDFDADGDGIAEKIKVTFCGEYEFCKILKWEEWPLYRAPLFAACSVPMPHQAVGLCLADLVSDIQDLRTEVSRQYLDCLALSNQGEIVVNEGSIGGQVEYDSLLARGVGAVHRIRGDAAINPLPIATSSREALDGLDMSSGMIERRTGISPRTQSLQADALQNTATGASIMEEAINQRLELIARVYAEMFFKPLGKYLLHLVHRYQDKAIQLRLKGRFMQFDPRKWDPDMDIAVAVGLGTGDRSRLVSTYQSILGLQQAFIQQLGQNSPVRLTNIVYTCHKLCEAAGLEAPERFFGTEEDARQAEQAMMQQGGEPSEEEQKIMLDQQKAQAKIQLDQQKAQTEAQRKAYETQADIALKEQEVQGKLALKKQEMATEAQLDATRLMMGERGGGLTNIRGVA